MSKLKIGVQDVCGIPYMFVHIPFLNPGRSGPESLVYEYGSQLKAVSRYHLSTPEKHDPRGTSPHFQDH
jgi:hypothetical protein